MYVSCCWWAVVVIERCLEPALPTISRQEDKERDKMPSNISICFFSAPAAWKRMALYRMLKMLGLIDCQTDAAGLEISASTISKFFKRKEDYFQAVATLSMEDEEMTPNKHLPALLTSPGLLRGPAGKFGPVIHTNSAGLAQIFSVLYHLFCYQGQFVHFKAKYSLLTMTEQPVDGLTLEGAETMPIAQLLSAFKFSH